MQTDDYKVELEVFEGPLDLLLYLIRKDEIDIYDIPIESVTRQYMAYLNLMKMLDLNIAGEFLVMSATLMMIKSRMLLPVEDRQEEEPEDEADPRWELVRQLVEYKKFKDIANQLQERELRQENIFGLGGRSAVVPEGDAVEVALADVSIFDLMAAFQEVLDQAPPERIGEIAGDRFTVPEKIDAVLTAVRKRRQLKFSNLFKAMASRNEIICTFLAVLELLRLNQIKAVQGSVFGEIYITPNADAEPLPENGRRPVPTADEYELEL